MEGWNMSLIVYASKKGTSKKYAILLSELTGVNAVDVNTLKYAHPYETIVFIGPMYAGNVHGLKQLNKIIPLNECHRVICGIVGANNPTHPEVVSEVNAAVHKLLPDGTKNVSVHLLRGDYKHSKLSFTEKLIMFGLKKGVDFTPPDKVPSYTKEMLSFLNKDVSFFDSKYLNPIIEELNT